MFSKSQPVNVITFGGDSDSYLYVFAAKESVIALYLHSDVPRDRITCQISGVVVAANCRSLRIYHFARFFSFLGL